MLAEAKLQKLRELSNELSKNELIWTQGFLAGILSAKGEEGQQLVPSSESSAKKISILYGTVTGNAKALATRFSQKGRQNGLVVKLTSLDQYRPADLAREETVLIVISTHGEGEPPASAKKFYDYIFTEKINIKKVNYAVLALGDTAYPLFCKAGEDVDNQLSVLGGRRIQHLQKCDVNFEETALSWFDGIAIQIKNSGPSTITKKITNSEIKTGRKFYKGKILTSINLNGSGSNKETYHIEIGCDEKIIYQPGDALGIIPENRRDIVHQLLKLTGTDASTTVSTTKFSGTVQELLTKHLNICHLSTINLRSIGTITGHDIPDIRMDLVDVLRIHPVKDSLQFLEILKTLSPIAPRLYSISSAPSYHENEIHITVAQNSFQVQEEIKFGLCSRFIGTLEEGTSLEFYIHENRHFKLPAPDKDMIMIGPGSGIAAMRSFLYEREATGASGRNWLFFGDQHFTTDFLYQTEIQKWLETGVLTHLSVAFSRDQEEKIYVQHKMESLKNELYEWIENGACLFVSGTRDPMSKDVEKILLKIIERNATSQTQAEQFLESMKEDNRYMLDVY